MQFVYGNTAKLQTILYVTFAFMFVIFSWLQIKNMWLKNMCAACQFEERASLHFINILVTQISSLVLLLLFVITVSD